MVTMAEIEESWPERREALNEALGTQTMEEFGRKLKAGIEATNRVLRESGHWTSMSELLERR